jgi:subtilisin family serine protease
MSVTPEELKELVKLPEVGSVIENGLNFPSLSSSRPVMGADVAHTKGFDGAGSVVAVLDTGVDSSHPALSSNILKSDAACFSGTTAWWATSFCPSLNPTKNLVLCKDKNGKDIPKTACGVGAADPAPSFGIHGTHVAGIVAADGTGGVKGVAPKAKILPVQVFVGYDYDQNGTLDVVAYDSDIIRGLEHVLLLSTKHNIVAANMSLGGGVITSTATCDTPKTKPPSK